MNHREILSFDSSSFSSGRFPRRGKRGFTLVEMLTVMAVIAVLVTLLLSAVSSAKKFSKQARCISNLHQIALGTTMYLDDHKWVPMELTNLTASGYLPNKDVLICPSDRLGNWGNLVDFNPAGTASPTAGNPVSLPASGDAMGAEERLSPREIPFSYLHSLNWEKWAWTRLIRAEAGAGFATCQLHGLGRQDAPQPSMRDFEGLILRARMDGAVVRKQFFWETGGNQNRLANTSGDTAAFAPSGSAELENPPNSAYPWGLFTEIPPGD